MAFELRRLPPEALSEVYRLHLTVDFPRKERRPLSSIRRLIAAGVYDTWGLYQDGQLAAYGFLWSGADADIVLLDYLGAVKKGQGLGTTMLHKLISHYGPTRGMLAEVEAELPDAPEQRNLLRARRIMFYQRAGFRRLAYTADIFRVRYTMLLWGGQTEAAAIKTHRALYESTLPAWLYRQMIHIPESGRAKQGTAEENREEE